MQLNSSDDNTFYSFMHIVYGEPLKKKIRVVRRFFQVIYDETRHIYNTITVYELSK